MRKFIRSLIALVAVVTAYGLYALAVVPFIEPAAGPKREQVVSSDDLQAAQDAVMLQRKDLRRWFKDGDWELTARKILETAQGKLLMETYINQPDGTVVLEPCTVVLTPQGQFATEEERDRRAVVLRAPKATLKFDSAVDFRRAKFGKLLGGLLHGKVTIQSGQKAAGPEDDLWVETKDVQLIEDQIVTPHAVDFRLGPNHGHGVDLAIALHPTEEKPSAAKTPDLGSVKSLELHRDVQVHLEMEGGGIIPVEEVATAGPPPVPVPGLLVPGVAASDGPQPPVEITCQGMFRFDFENHVARFHDSVDVLRRNPVGPSDQLNCEVLALHFAPAEGTQVVPGKMPRLQPVWLEAHGNPVVIRSPRSGVHARGQVLKYHLKTRRVSLSSPREVIVQRPTDEIRTRELHYELGNGKQLGQLYAVGPGWARGIVPEQAASSVPGGGTNKEPKRFEARWTKELRFRPHEQNYVLSLAGDAHVSQPGMGGLDGQEIHVWLVEEPAPAASGKAKMRMFPDRILAQNQVHLTSQPLTGDVETLQVWIRRPGQPAPQQTTHRDNRLQRAVWQSGTGPVRTLLLTQYQPPQPTAIERTARATPPTLATLPDPIRLPSSATQSPPPQPAPETLPEPVPPAGAAPKYQLTAQALRVELVAYEDHVDLTRAVAQENVRFGELAGSATGQEPLIVAGDMLELEQPSVPTPPGQKPAQKEPMQQMLVHITGQPAQVDARGMTLVGGTIHADQAGNRLWIDGPGRMSLPVSGEVGGLAAGSAPRKLDVSWKGDMNFDGQLAQFHQGVFSQLDRQVLETGALDVVLAQRIDFARRAAGGAASTRPDVERLLCHEGVLLTRETFEGNQRTARERLRVSEMAIHQRTGAIQGQGPGWIRTVRQGAGDTLPIKLPGGVAQPDAAFEPNELTYVGVDFQQEVTGNLHQRELTFHEQIKLVYAPADDWDTSIDPFADPRELGQKAMRMESDELQVVQMAQQGAPSAMELTALGNVVVEGAMFNARADRAAFAEAKDRLLLEGNGRTHATLSRQELVGGPAATVTAGKFSYWLSTGKWRIDEGQSIDPGVLPPK